MCIWSIIFVKNVEKKCRERNVEIISVDHRTELGSDHHGLDLFSRSLDGNHCELPSSFVNECRIVLNELVKASPISRIRT